MSESSSSQAPATIAIALGISMFLAAPFLVSQMAQQDAEAGIACLPEGLPILAAEPERLARLMIEIEESEWRDDCVLARHRMTPEEMDETMERLQANPERLARYRAELVSLRAAASEAGP